MVSRIAKFPQHNSHKYTQISFGLFESLNETIEKAFPKEPLQNMKGKTLKQDLCSN